MMLLDKIHVNRENHWFIITLFIVSLFIVSLFICSLAHHEVQGKNHHQTMPRCLRAVLALNTIPRNAAWAAMARWLAHSQATSSVSSTI